MIQHILLVKFGEDTTKEQMMDVCERFKALNGRIPGMVEAQAGVTFSAHNHGYQVVLTAKFQNITYLEQYGPHPEHRIVATYIREVGRVDSIVMDIEI